MSADLRRYWCSWKQLIIILPSCVAPCYRQIFRPLVDPSLAESTQTSVEHYTGSFLLRTHISIETFKTLSCSVWDEVIQFWPYRPSLMTERKFNCLSISPTLPLPSLSVSFCRCRFSSFSSTSLLCACEPQKNHPSIKPLCCVCTLCWHIIRHRYLLHTASTNSLTAWYVKNRPKY